MTSFLEGLWLWVLYTLGAMVYLIIALVLICAPPVMLSGVVYVLAKLFVRVRETGGEGTGDAVGRRRGGSPLRDPRVEVQVERARETRRKDGRGGGKDREGRADPGADPGDGAGAVP
jgi:hypothetical protein